MERAYALELVGRPDLLARILAFNAASGPQNEFKYADQAAADQLSALRAQYPALQLFAARPRPLQYFAEKRSRLALLSDAELQSLCRILGAARLADFLRQAVRREELAAIYALIGEKLYHFVLNFASFALPVTLKASGSLEVLQQCTALGAELVYLMSGDIDDGRVRTCLQQRLGALMPAAAAAPELTLEARQQVRLWRLTAVILSSQMEIALG